MNGIICRPFYLTREFSSIIVTAVYIPPQADTSLALSKLTMCSAATLANTLTLPLSSQGTVTKPIQAGHVELLPTYILSN